MKSLLSRIKQVFMKQMWEKKKKEAQYCCNHSKCVEKSDTFGSELAGKVLLSSVRSSLKWYKEGKDKTSHWDFSAVAQSAVTRLFNLYFPPSGRGGNSDGDWVGLDAKQTKENRQWWRSAYTANQRKVLKNQRYYQRLGKPRKSYYMSSQKAAVTATSLKKSLGGFLELSLALLQTHDIHIYRHELRKAKRWYGHSGVRWRAIRSSAGPVPLVSQSHILGKMPAAWFAQLILCQGGSFKRTPFKKRYRKKKKRSWPQKKKWSNQKLWDLHEPANCKYEPTWISHKKVRAQRKDETYFWNEFRISAQSAVLHPGDSFFLTSCECYFKHRHRDDRLQQNYQKVFPIQKMVVLTHGAFLQEERAAGPATLGAQHQAGSKRLWLAAGVNNAPYGPESDPRVTTL